MALPAFRARKQLGSERAETTWETKKIRRHAVCEVAWNRSARHQSISKKAQRRNRNVGSNILSNAARSRSPEIDRLRRPDKHLGKMRETLRLRNAPHESYSHNKLS